jgi:hypothetical protein
MAAMLPPLRQPAAEGGTPLSTFMEELAPARTFCFEDWIAPLLAAGLGTGGSLDNTLVLTENNCAIHRVAEHHPAVCSMELSLLRQVLGPDVEVTRVAHAMAGDAVCSYCIRPRTE